MGATNEAPGRQWFREELGSQCRDGAGFRGNGEEGERALSASPLGRSGKTVIREAERTEGGGDLRNDIACVLPHRVGQLLWVGCHCGMRFSW